MAKSNKIIIEVSSQNSGDSFLGFYLLGYGYLEITIKEVGSMDIINEIGNLLCDKTVGILAKDKQLQGKDEKFGSMITLTYLQKKIYPLLEELKTKVQS